MKSKKGFGVKSSLISTISAFVVIIIGFTLSGCNEEVARIESRQLELEAMAETNTEQIAALDQRIEQNQHELQAGIEQVQKDIRNVANDTAVVSKEQMKLQKTVQNNERQTTEKIAVLEQGQIELRVGIDQTRDTARNVASDMATDITAIKDEQAALQETLQNNSRQFTNNIAVIEQNQQQWQSKVEELQQNFQIATTRINTLSDDLLKLQDVLQSNIRELVGMMDRSGKEQLKFQEKIQTKLLAFDNSISAIKLSQEKLQNQIEDIRNSAEIMSSELPAAIEQLREEIARNNSMGTEENHASPEANSTE